MKKILLISLAFLTFLACKKKDVDNSGEDKVAEKKVVKTGKLEIITFSKSSCYGTCPAYTATITEEGDIDFNGRAHTPLIGSHMLKTNDQFLENVMRKAEEIKFFSLNDKYDNKFVTDIPSTTLKIQTNKNDKSIYSRYETPKGLVELNNFIHEEIMRLVEVEKIKTQVSRDPKVINKYRKGEVRPETDKKIHR